MSVKKEYETKTHMVTEQVLIKETRCCDVCGKEIKSENSFKKPYWSLTTHHNDWGNDSIESYEYYDVCSKDCLKQKFDEYVEDSNEWCDGHNTMCFDVEKTY
jgi:hypothetical protein